MEDYAGGPRSKLLLVENGLTYDQIRDAIFLPLLQLCKLSLQGFGITTFEEKDLSLRHVQWDEQRMQAFITKQGHQNKLLTSIIGLIRHVPEDLCYRAQGTNNANWSLRWAQHLASSVLKNELLEQLLESEPVSSLCGTIIADIELLDGIQGKSFHNLVDEEVALVPFSQKNTQERDEAEERQEEALFERELEAAAVEVSKGIDGLVKGAMKKGISFPTSMQTESGKQATPGLSPIAAAVADALEKVSMLHEPTKTSFLLKSNMLRFSSQTQWMLSLSSEQTTKISLVRQHSCELIWPWNCSRSTASPLSL